MQKVRRKKTIIGTVELSYTCGREICNAPLPPTSLGIVVMSEQWKGAITVPEYSGDTVNRLRSAVELIQALRNLRNIGELSFDNAKPTYCPRFNDHLSENMTYREVDYVTKDTLYHPVTLLLKAELRALVTGNSPVELLCNMNQYPLDYAKIYERFTTYRTEMGRNRVHRGDSLCGLTRRVNRRIISPTEIWFNPSWPHNHHKFQHHLGHPIEVGLDKCNTSADGNDVVTFKSERRIILQYLERQKHKCKYGLFDINREREPSSDFILQGYCDSMMEEQTANGCVLLETYADTFKREQTVSKKQQLRECEQNSMAIKDVLQAIRNSQDGWNRNAWAENFIIAFDDVEKQLEELQKARRGIFSCDISSNWDCDFDIQLGQTNRKRVDWSFHAPGFIRYWSLTIWYENGEARRLD
ncbi:uncharacterized protein EAF01_003105 [Botrytis porri]|uniref:uncharacterized protein n=1 Tax=Botrytis porri TaxID=87229 RepID=UPI0018FFCAB8|nr:uncharacterized protein EAF01_003105 [Botrytis porri]KAF7909387.1 hypothetical protein EAF01_003105 [Botrytis porri]